MKSVEFPFLSCGIVKDFLFYNLVCFFTLIVVVCWVWRTLYYKQTDQVIHRETFARDVSCRSEKVFLYHHKPTAKFFPSYLSLLSHLLNSCPKCKNSKAKVKEIQKESKLKFLSPFVPLSQPTFPLSYL